MVFYRSRHLSIAVGSVRCIEALSVHCHCIINNIVHKERYGQVVDHKKRVFLVF